MKLTERSGKQLFVKYGITIPQESPAAGTVVIKAQVLSGDRAKAGGIIKTDVSGQDAAVRELRAKTIGGERVVDVLVEAYVPHEAEYYLSFSYDSATRGPVMSVSSEGGSGIVQAHTSQINILSPEADMARALHEAGFPQEETEGLVIVVQKLWRLFIEEYATLAEINPLFKIKNGYVAGDAKVILDDAKVSPGQRPFIEMDGDIAMLLSGGGASMLAMDALLRAGGRPANYSEYSGNPPAEVVKELTKKVLSRTGLKGCLVVGAAANFTDIYVTLSGFLEGLRELPEIPRYPIVIRRDGPRQSEAFAMLKEAATQEGYDLHLYDSSLPIVEGAKKIVALAYP